MDECSTHTSLSPIYGWSRRGHRAYFEAPRNWGANVTLLSSMTCLGMVRDGAFDGGGGTHHPRSLRSLPAARVLAPSLKPGQIVVMDNLSSHKGSRVRELIEGRGCELHYLPPYSPDLNPIEEAFAKIKALLRRLEAHPRSAAGSDGLVARCGECERCPGLL